MNHYFIDWDFFFLPLCSLTLVYLIYFSIFLACLSPSEEKMITSLACLIFRKLEEEKEQQI